MYGYFIAIPTRHKGDYLDFWSFIKDDGRTISNYEVRFHYNSNNIETTKRMLAQAKRDYLRDELLFMAQRVRVAYSESKSRRAIYDAKRNLEEVNKFYTRIGKDTPLNYR